MILDAGCGTGEVARLLADLGHQVVGLDRSADMICEARRSRATVADPPVYLQGDVERLPFRSGRFTVVVCVGVLGYILSGQGASGPRDAALPAIEELIRVLNPGGFLVISAPNLIRLHWLLDPHHLLRALRHQARLRTLAGDSSGFQA